MPGATFSLVRTREEAQLWQQHYGKVAYAGAWDERWWHEAMVVPPLPEGAPTTKPAQEDAAHFLIRMVHKYPHEVTIYEGGPMTNLALAISQHGHVLETGRIILSDTSPALRSNPKVRSAYLGG